ncbi:hypothetical protein ACHAWF_014798 [Thalassiosira exigua]
MTEEERSYLLVGILTYSEGGPTSCRKHTISGTWKHLSHKGIQSSTHQYFKLSRIIPPNEDFKELPKDGEFRSSFRFGDKTVKDSGVMLAFLAKDGEEGTFSVKGTGANKLGTFEIEGTATKTNMGTEAPTYSVTLRKMYTAPPGAKSSPKKQRDKKRKHAMKSPPESHGEATTDSKILTLVDSLFLAAKKDYFMAAGKSYITVGNIYRCVAGELGIEKLRDMHKVMISARLKSLINGTCEAGDRHATGPMQKKRRVIQDHERNIRTSQSSPRSVSKFRFSTSPYGQDPTQIIADDAKLANSLQKKEMRLTKESDDMLTTTQGIAYKFVESILKECKSIPRHQDVIIEPVAVDDMVHQAEGLLKCKETFESVGKESIVDLGFHFTDESRLEHIRRDGLMTIADRNANPKLSPEQARRTHGRTFGDGVYTGNYPCTLTRYGGIGLIVARLKGNTRRISPEEIALEGTLKKPALRPMVPLGEEALADGFDSLIGNKDRGNNEKYDEIILLRSVQCIPLIRFPSSVLSACKKRDIPDILHPWVDVMKKAVTYFFNNDPANLSSGKRLRDTLGDGSSDEKKETPSFEKVAKHLFNNDPANLSSRKRLRDNLGDGANDAKMKAPRMHNAKQPSSSHTQQVTFMLPNASQGQSGTSQTNDAQASGKTRVPPVSNAAAPVISNKAIHSSTGGGIINRATTTHWSSTQQHRQIRNIAKPPSTGGISSRATSTMVPHTSTNNTAGSGKNASPTAQSIIYAAPDNLTDTRLVENLDVNTVVNDETCIVCMEKLNKSDDLLKVKRCQHIFCRDCILQNLQHSRKCPSCQVLIGEPQGKSPSGQMLISIDRSIHCAGYSNANTIVIHYILSRGKQQEYHDDPGKPFKGIRRLAYLPDNEDGHRLLARLKFAFLHGLTFRVGTSLTTGKSGVITWASIHHKTALATTSHGWPDETYFVRCNEELDCLGVPKADDCKGLIELNKYHNVLSKGREF